MQIDIPHDLIQRLQQHSADPVEAIRLALDSLDHQDRELAAIQAGLESADAGRTRPLGEFDEAFRNRNGIV